MEDKNESKVISNETSTLERIAFYQKELSQLNINPLQCKKLEDGTDVFHFQLSKGIMRSWLLDIFDELKLNEERERATSLRTHCEKIINLPIINIQINDGYSSSVVKNNLEEGNYKLIEESLFEFECFLKKMTNKYFSSRKPKKRLIQ